MTESTVNKHWIEAISVAIDHVNSAACAQYLLQAIGKLVTFDMAMSVVYRRHSKPIYVCDTFKTDKAKQGLSNYINNTYVLNPAYSAYCRKLYSGVYRIHELSLENQVNIDHYHSLKIKRMPNEELEYITECWPPNMEEVFIAITLPADEMGEISLLRARSKGGFSECDIDHLNVHLPMITSIYRQYWIKARCNTSIDDSVPPIDYLLESVFDSYLSTRENQVAMLTLKGDSGQDIADELGIGLTTVKTHRKNLYGKLGITTQTELFLLALNTLTRHI
ncbi:MAG: DNA-binding CsgD family transcriptional regulator [Gammaproteobacteria bacterium]|jgi:DNA-binding CsgD family transcriptional regulator